MKFIGLFLMLLTILACNNQNSNQKSNRDKQSMQNGQLEANTEIEKWKQELLETKQIASPCYFRKTLDSADFVNWYKNNPNQNDGLPLNDKDILSLSYDFDSDNKEDLLLYFMAENCSGHNGNPKTYAKIIYSNGNIKSNLMNDIINAIQIEYNNKRKTNNLKEITDSYLESTTTISSGNESWVFGSFSLYTKDDAHCCPSYTGKYRFDHNKNKIEINLFQEIILK